MTTKTNSQPNKSRKNTPEELPWYKKTGAIITLLVFSPPVGIPLFIKFMEKPAKKARIAISAVWGGLFVIAFCAYLVDSSRTFEMDGNTIKIECGAYCSTMERYGDPGITKILAASGITKVKRASSSLNSDKAEVTVDIKDTDKDIETVVVEFSSNKVSKVYNKAFPEVIYYSTNSDDTVVKYPAKDAIAKKRHEAEDQKKAEEEQKKAEAEQQQAEEARYPSEGGTAELCEQQFHKNYPWNGSKVHSMLGVYVNSKYLSDSRIYKVKVTIANAYGASYDATMECVVQKSGEYIKITSFNVY